MSIEEFAEKFIKAENEAWQNGNIGPLEKLEHPDVVYHMAALGEVKGFEMHKQHILGMRQAVSDIRQEWQYLTGEGNLFALSYKMSGKLTGKTPGMPPSVDKEVTSNQLCLFRIKNGKVIEGWANGTITGLT